MAYNTSKGPRGLGDIEYEGDPKETRIDFENDYIALVTNNLNRFVVSGSDIQVTTVLSSSANISASAIYGVSEGVFGSLTVAGTFTPTDVSASSTVVGSLFRTSGSVQVLQPATTNGGSAHYVFIGKQDEGGVLCYYRNDSAQDQAVVAAHNAVLGLEGATGKHIYAKLGSTANTEMFQIQDSGNNTKFHVTALGNVSASAVVTAQEFAGGNLNRGYVNKLMLDRPTVSTVRIATGSCTDATDTVYMNNTASITVDITVSGIDGLDNGSEASSTWYAIYVVSGSTGMGGLLVAGAGVPYMPSGYKYYRRVGWAYNHSDDDLQNFVQTGTGNERGVHWLESITDYTGVVSLGTSAFPARTAVDCSSRVPPTAHAYGVRAYATGSTSGTNAALLPLAVSGTMGGGWMALYPNEDAGTGGAGAGVVATQFGEFPVGNLPGENILGFDYMTSWDCVLVSAAITGWKETL
jgi:hypothetical protein